MHKLPYFLSNDEVILLLFGIQSEFTFPIQKPLIVNGWHGGNLLGFQKFGVLLRPGLIDQIDSAASNQVLSHELRLHRFSTYSEWYLSGKSFFLRA